MSSSIDSGDVHNVHWSVVCAGTSAAHQNANVAIHSYLRWIILALRPPKAACSDLPEERHFGLGRTISVNQRCIVRYDAIEHCDVAVELRDPPLFISAKDLLSV